ncbi:hypothetical protein SteCoe_30391 [Stentor coeruleus]|uniref:C2H2-type domain-containing protein n=1 Tax=Stentor coeruleus TaxID=5963 RepID=A0A1R2B467_9CILI|nr:hypothetical protein SteCoe_30391 [Stentor coeruleus]
MKDLYKCKAAGCEKSYVSNAILKRHILAFHSLVNKYQCKACNKSLASRQNLKEHMYIHTGEKPYKCPLPECQMSFRQGTHLSAHKKFHQKNPSELNIQKLFESYLSQEHIDDMSVKNPDFILPAFVSIIAKAQLPNVF